MMSQCVYDAHDNDWIFGKNSETMSLLLSRHLCTP